MSNNIEGKIVVVIGGSSGLGKASCPRCPRLQSPRIDARRPAIGYALQSPE
jgi:hypothetical protein